MTTAYRGGGELTEPQARSVAFDAVGTLAAGADEYRWGWVFWRAEPEGGFGPGGGGPVCVTRRGRVFAYGPTPPRIFSDEEPLDPWAGYDDRTGWQRWRDAFVARLRKWRGG